jgi:DnaK suppressor protein
VNREADTVDEFRQRLREAWGRLFRTVTRTDEELATLEAHQPGAQTEDASTELVGEILSRLEGREKHELDEIHAARARLEAGTFGICDRCRRPIPLARLRALPAALYCAPCQSREETSPGRGSPS